MLLAVKGSGLGAVGSNAAFGDPNAGDAWLGPYYGNGGIEARQGAAEPTPVDEPVFVDPIEVPDPRPLINEPPSIPLGPGPVILDDPAPLFNVSTPDSPTIISIPINSTETPILIIAPPLPVQTVAPVPVSNPNAPIPAFPNLFDSYHPPSAFALTLSSLFGETHTERADLRPLGPDAPSGSSPNSIE